LIQSSAGVHDLGDNGVQMESLIKTLSGELVEVKHFDDKSVVQSGPQSVNDFL
jgi:hypothetical protein